jgi:hypothetical protein
LDLGRRLAEIQKAFVTGAVACQSHASVARYNPYTNAMRSSKDQGDVPSDVAKRVQDVVATSDAIATAYTQIVAVARLALAAIARGDETTAVEMFGRLDAMAPRGDAPVTLARLQRS